MSITRGDVLSLIGFVLIVAGVGFYSLPTAVIVAGVMLLSAGLLMTRNGQ